MPMYAGFSPDDVMLEPLWQYAEKNGLPVLLHMGTTFIAQAPLAFTLPRLIEPVALRHPGLKIILGHMGEFLPFMRWRFDSRFAAYPHGLTLAKAPSAYFQSNIVITTSGVCSAPALMGAIGEMGVENVMSSIDYPYESTAAACEFLESAPLDEASRALVCSGNARRLFKL